LNLLKGLTVSGTSLVLPGITNLFAGDLTVDQGAALTLPNLFSYNQGGGCNVNTWLISGAGSVLDLSSLTNLAGSSCGSLALQALNGGQLLLGGLTNIFAGHVQMLSSGSGSVVDLHALANFLNPANSSRLTTTNGGTILLNEQPSIFSGVALNIAAGTPNLAPISLPATNLVLHGDAWRSYQVEQRDTTSPANPWTDFRRVPLTNAFQVIGRPAPANREFRAWEFIADPHGLDLTVEGDVARLVLYAPTNQTLEVESTTNLMPVVIWETLDTVTMTNTFRIFTPSPLSEPQRFFRTIPL
jgi:hypothetical protein